MTCCVSCIHGTKTGEKACIACVGSNYEEYKKLGYIGSVMEISKYEISIRQDAHSFGDFTIPILWANTHISAFMRKIRYIIDKECHDMLIDYDRFIETYQEFNTYPYYDDFEKRVMYIKQYSVQLIEYYFIMKGE